MPEWVPQIAEAETHPIDENNEYAYSYQKYIKK